MKKRKRALYIAFCSAVCEYSKYCEWFTAAEYSTPEDCPVKTEEIFAALERGDLKIHRRILRRAARYVRKKERDFKKHPEYLKIGEQKENHPR